MAFVWKADQRLKSPEQVARELLEVAKARGLDEFAAVLAVMCVAQESDFWCPANEKDPSSKNYPHDALSNDGRSVAYFQQQNGRAGDTLPAGDRDDWWGPMASRMDLKRSADVFYDRLEDNYRDAINNPLRAAQFIQNVQQSYWNGKPDHPGYYGKHWDRAWALVRSSTTEETPMAVSGDPVWLEDVLRPALGDRLKTIPGWKESGVGGTMGQIWGTVWHHTGSARATAQSIRDGRPDLPGPLSQLHIAQDGTVTIVAVGPCNHAGKGSWAGLPTDAANDRTIGIECAYPKDVNNQAEPWPDAQIIAMRDTGAALTKHMGVPVSHNISHKEWAQFGPAGFRQGKTDPWNLDMDWFRSEIKKDMDGFVFPGEHPPIDVPPPVKRFPEDWTDRELMLEILRQLRGPALKGWEQLGGKSVVDAIAELGKP